MNRARRGFTLIELMIAGTIGIIIITGVLSAGLYLQQQGLVEMRQVQAQVSVRAAADQISLDLQGAGLGIGSARVNTGGTNGSSAITVTTADPFTADGTFAAAAAPYAARVSDSLTVMAGDPAQMVQMGCCGGGGPTCGSCRFRSGANACAAAPVPVALNGQTLVFVNPTLNVSCLHEVTGLPSVDRIQTNPGRGNNPPPPGDPCEEASATFWCTAGAYALQLSTVSYRVNWAPRAVGQPQRPRLQRDPDGPGPAPWEDVMWDVEQMTVRVGVVDFTNANNLRFYPDAAAGRPAIDQCTAATCPVQGGVITGPGVPAGNPVTLANDVVAGGGLSATMANRVQLERRVRLVEVTLLTRSSSVTRERIEPLGAGFRLDPEGLPLDGYARRRLTFQITPRNFRLAGEP